MGDNASSERLLLCDTWYARNLGDGVVFFNDVLHNLPRPLQQLAAKSATARALLLILIGRRFQFIAPHWPRYGRRAAIIASVLTRKRRVVMLEAIDVTDLHLGTARTWIYKTLSAVLLRQAFRRSVAMLQAMTEWEAERFRVMYGLKHSVVTVHWPLGFTHETAQIANAPQRKDCRDYVMASGRAACDWETIARVAAHLNYRFIAVCSREDEERVRSLMTEHVEIHVDIPLTAHDALLHGARVYFLSLQERMASAGQIRLGEAIAASVPVVATRIRGLEGYLVDGQTAISVDTGDWKAAVGAIRDLMENDEMAAHLVATASNFAMSRNRDRYFVELANLIRRLQSNDR